jgi:predicted AlkP superfamily pyrophosphatase or phosphodiesterase
MRLNVLIVFIGIITVGCSSKHSYPAKHVILISLDGSRPVFYMDSTWHAPHLKKLKRKGVYVAKGIESVFPTRTFPAHTTIITGAYPATHGIYYNKIAAKSVGGVHYWYACEIKCPTLWDAVKKAGMTSGAVLWPVSIGAPINYNVPERRPERWERENILTIKYPYITPKNLFSDFEKKSGYKLTVRKLKYGKFAKDKAIAKISNYIIKTYKPNLMAIHFIGIDHQEHLHGIDAPEVKRAVAITDSLIGTILKAVKDAGIWNSTAILIVGDHGQTNTKAIFAPNVYLAKHGLITQKGWKAKFHEVTGSAFLYVKDKSSQAMVDSVVTILKNTPEYKNGDFRILDREALDKMGACPNVPLALSMKPGITVRSGTKGKTFKKAYGSHGNHGYDPAYSSMHTVFIAYGAGIGKHKSIKGMGIKDIAPVIEKLLGLKFSAPDGKLIPGIIQLNKR